jgi:hypothetical protein
MMHDGKQLPLWRSELALTPPPRGQNNVLKGREACDAFSLRRPVPRLIGLVHLDVLIGRLGDTRHRVLELVPAPRRMDGL